VIAGAANRDVDHRGERVTIAERLGATGCRVADRYARRAADEWLGRAPKRLPQGID